MAERTRLLVDSAANPFPPRGFMLRHREALGGINILIERRTENAAGQAPTAMEALHRLVLTEAARRGATRQTFPLVNQALAQGADWTTIGKALGVDPEAAKAAHVATAESRARLAERHPLVPEYPESSLTVLERAYTAPLVGGSTRDLDTYAISSEQHRVQTSDPYSVDTLQLLRDKGLEQIRGLREVRRQQDTPPAHVYDGLGKALQLMAIGAALQHDMRVQQALEVAFALEAGAGWRDVAKAEDVPVEAARNRFVKTVEAAPKGTFGPVVAAQYAVALSSRGVDTGKGSLAG